MVSEAAPASEPFSDPAAEADYQAATRFLLNPPPSQQKVQLLVLSLVAFVAATFAQDAAKSFVELAMLLGILFVHELGHVAGMRLYGYRDVKMFFIPFFGAAASGRKRGVARWQQGVVLLLGPVPGIVIGTVLAYVAAAGVGSDALRMLALMTIVVNALNLLPIAQLDGGQLFQIMLFSRHRHLEIVFLGVTAALVVAVGVLGGLWFIAIIGAFMLLQLGHRQRVLAAAHHLRTERRVEVGELPQDPAAMTEPQRRALYGVMWGSLPPNWQKSWRGKAAAQANVMEDIHDRVVHAPPTANESVALGAVWLVALFVGFLGVGQALPPELAKPPAVMPVERVATPSWRRVHHQTPAFAVDMPGPATETASEIEGEGSSVLAVVADRSYAVWWQPVGDSGGRWIDTQRGAIVNGNGVISETQPHVSERRLIVERAGGAIDSVRLIVVGAVGFTVLATSPGPDPDAKLFLDSFEAR